VRRSDSTSKRRRKPAVPAPAKVPTGWRIRAVAGIQLLEATFLLRQPWIVHAFTLRPGGASSLDGQPVFNLGHTSWDTHAHVLANRGLLVDALGGDLHVIPQRQFHSDLARLYTSPPEHLLRGDAALTSTPGLLLAVLTADCIPILLADVRRRAVAAVHAGWRGTLRRIAAKTVGLMRLHFGIRPRDVFAVLGPGIGRCCYEVGAEVVQRFHSQFFQARDWFDGPFDRLIADDSPNPLQWLNMHPPGHQPPLPTARLDLFAANRWQLMDAGIPAGNIQVSPYCTACRTDLFFSHRREFGRTGRLMGVIGIRA
jgi:YfiH family protein